MEWRRSSFRMVSVIGKRECPSHTKKELELPPAKPGQDCVRYFVVLCFSIEERREGDVQEEEGRKEGKERSVACSSCVVLHHVICVSFRKMQYRIVTRRQAMRYARYARYARYDARTSRKPLFRHILARKLPPRPSVVTQEIPSPSLCANLHIIMLTS
jgi:hypothetical protein